MEKSKYVGMTVNERLYISSLMDEFDEAVRQQNVIKVREVLRKVELDEVSIKQILNSLNLTDSD
jgi:hypothetical protein